MTRIEIILAVVVMVALNAVLLTLSGGPQFLEAAE